MFPYHLTEQCLKANGEYYQNLTSLLQLTKIFQTVTTGHKDTQTEVLEYFKELTQRGIEVNRFDIYMARQSLHLNSCYKDRSPADCKFLQQALRFEWGFDDLPTNMIPMSHLEAILGAILQKKKKIILIKLNLYTILEGWMLLISVII